MKILIGYDGSECAEAALVDLLRAGLPAKLEATVLSAADVFLPPQDGTETISESFPNYVPLGAKLARARALNSYEKAEKLSQIAGDKVREMFPGWKVSTEAHADTPHWSIILKSEAWKPDLVVVGSHGRSGLGRAIFGSVSQKILYETGCSVRIARGQKAPVEKPIRLVLGTDGSLDADAMVEVVSSRRWRAGTEVKLITAVETFHQYSAEPDVHLNWVRDAQTGSCWA